MPRIRLQCASLIACLLGALSSSARAEQPADAPSASSTKQHQFKVRPHLLEAEDGDGPSLALDYEFKGSFNTQAHGSTSVGRPTISDDDIRTARPGYWTLDYLARGTVAASKDKNPNKLLDAGLQGHYVLDTVLATFQAGGVARYETDQSFDDRQHMFGMSASATRIGIFRPLAGKSDSLYLAIGYGSINPQKDAARQAVLASLDNYRRWDAELSYILERPFDAVGSIELDYRHYQEVGAPASIREASLSRHRFGLIRVNLKNDLFIQYSKGSLPFDTESKRVVKIGWTFKLE